MRLWRRRQQRFGELIQIQLDLFEREHHEQLEELAAAERVYRRSGAAESEELYGDYMDLVEQAEDDLLALRDHYAETMAARDRRRYEREFTRIAERALPTLVARRLYLRAIDPDSDL
jgi:hypothetical protein